MTETVENRTRAVGDGASLAGGVAFEGTEGGDRAPASLIGDRALRTVLAAGAGDRRQLLLAYNPKDLERTKIPDDGGEGD